MKRLNTLTALMLTFLMSFTACINNEDQDKSEDRLPSLANSFLKEKLPGYKIKEISETSNNNEKYIVTLNDNVIVVFNYEGYWQTITWSQELTSLLARFIGTTCATQLKEYHPNATITKLSVKSYGCRADAGNDGNFALEFVKDAGNNNVAYTYTYKGIDITDTPEKLPEAVTNFVNKHYNGIQADYIIIIDIKKDDEYLINLSDKTFLTMSADTKVLDVYNYTTKLPSSMIQLIPQALVAYVGEKDPPLDIHGIKINEGLHTVLCKTRSGNTFSYAYIDSDIGIYEYPENAFKEFLNTYIRPAGIEVNSTENAINKAPAYGVFNFVFTGYKGNSATVNAEFNKDGEWVSVFLYGAAIPDALLESLPEKIDDYIKEKYPNNKVIRLIKMPTYYRIILGGEIELNFTLEGEEID